MPQVQVLHEQWEARGVRVLAVTPEDAETVRAFMIENGYTLPMVVDVEGVVTSRWHIRSLPTTVLVDGNGCVAHVGIPSSVDAALDRLKLDAPEARSIEHLLARGMYLTVAERYVTATEAEQSRARSHPGLRRFAAIWAERDRSVARRARLALAAMVGLRPSEIRADVGSGLDACGWLRSDRESDAPLLGVILDGEECERDSGEGLIARRLRRHIILAALANGESPEPTSLDHRVHELEETDRAWAQETLARATSEGTVIDSAK